MHPGEAAMAGATHEHRVLAPRHLVTALAAGLLIALQLPGVLPPLLEQLRLPGITAARAAIKLTEVVGILLLIGYLVIRLADRPFSRYRAYFLAALLVVNLRYYLGVLLPGQRLVADAMSLLALHLIFISQVAAVLESGRQWAFIARTVLTSGLLLMSVLDLAVIAGGRTATSAPVQVGWSYWLYEVIFAVSALSYVLMLLFMYWRAAGASLDVGVKWRFRFLVLAAFWYLVLHLYEFERRAHHLSAPELLLWKDVFAALGILNTLGAFLMPRWLEGALLWLQDRVTLPHLHSDLIFLAGFISEKLPSAASHPLVRLSGLVAEELSFCSQEKQVLRTAASLAVLARPRTWANVGYREAAISAPSLSDGTWPGNQTATQSGAWAGNPVEYPGDANVTRKYRNRLAVLGRVATVLRYYERWWPYLEAGRQPWTGRLRVPREAAVLLLVHLYLREKTNHRGCFPPSMVAALRHIVQKEREPQ